MTRLILFTGASSFTGYHFVNRLSKEKKNIIYCLLTKKKKQYKGLKALRLSLLKNKKNIRFFYNISFGEKKFFFILNKFSFNFLCLHGAYTHQYNNDEEFSISDALKSNLNKIDILFKNINNKKTKIILTNSIFQKNEKKKNYISIGKYGLTKFITHEVFHYLAIKYKVDITYFFIPNPWGILEEKRFLYYLIKTWKNGKTPIVKSPIYIRDNIYVDDLSKNYLKLFSKKSFPSYVYPSGAIISNLNFAKKIKTEFEKYTCKKFKLKKYLQKKLIEPIKRVNSKKKYKNKIATQKQLSDYFKYYDNLLN